MREVILCCGVRPDIIKMIPIIKELRRIKAPFKVLNLNQHTSKSMSKDFFKEMGEEKIDLLDLQIVSSQKRSVYLNNVIGATSKYFESDKHVVALYGDTLSALGAYFSAKRKGVKTIHIEAGLRCYDLSLPEEMTRIIIDSDSELLLCPCENHKENLLEEKVTGKICVTGNSVTDAIRYIKKKIGDVEEGNAILVTLHRPENVDDPLRLCHIIDCLNSMEGEIKWPVHPRTKERIEDMNLFVNKNVEMISPMNYFNFVKEMMVSKLIISDSGGIQEECSLLKKRLITIRRNTERQETLEESGNHTLIDIGTHDVETFTSLVNLVRMSPLKNSKGPYDMPDGESAARNIAKKIAEFQGEKNE